MFSPVGILVLICMISFGFTPNLWARDSGVTLCTDKALDGAYGVTGKGVLVSGGSTVSVSRVVFDGNGGFAVKGTASRDGVISGGEQLIGRYVVNSDCTGVIKYDRKAENLVLPEGYFVVAVARGEFRLVGFEPAVVMDFVAKRQFLDAVSQPCSNASLQGKFVSTGGGEFVGKGVGTGVGIITFDGKNELKVVRTFNMNGRIISDERVAWYEVDADCTGRFSYPSEERLAPYAATTFDRFVVDDDGKEVRIIGADPARVLSVIVQKQFSN